MANPGVPFDLSWVQGAALDDQSAARRAVRFRSQAPSTEPEVVRLRSAVACLDLTDLRVDASEAEIRALCALATSPLPQRSGPEDRVDRDPTVAAVCVLPSAVATAVRHLGDSGVPVAAACGFFTGGGSLQRMREEIASARGAGAREVDAVVDRALILEGAWGPLYEEVSALRAASEGLTLKVILGTGMLPSSGHVFRASLVSALAGADFLKTSTGRDPVNASLSAGIAMADAIRDYEARTGFRVGLKPAGGLRAPEDASAWLDLAGRELGTPWTHPGLFRIGASSLLDALRDRIHALGGG